MARVTDYKKPVTAKDFQLPTQDNEKTRHLARQVTRLETFQVTATDATLVLGFARGAGRIVAARALTAGPAPAAGESMDVDIQINGVTCLDGGDIAIPAAGTPKAWYDGAIDPAASDVVLGDKITAVLDYTAGGGPAPMTDTVIEVDVEYSE